MISLKDQLNRTLELPTKATRIISLVPSLTELLSTLKLEKEVVGLTKFCVHPKDWKKNKMIVGGTKQFHFDRISEISPDLIIANKEENPKEAIEVLSQSYPVYISEINTLEDCFNCIQDIGLLTARDFQAHLIIDQIKHSFNESFCFKNKPSVAYCIWKDPWMFAGTDTFIHHMLLKAGLWNVILEPRYPILSLEKVKTYQPDFIFLSSEPFPFKKEHTLKLQKQFPDSKIILVDGELFSWYGSRLLKFPPYIKSLRSKLQAS